MIHVGLFARLDLVDPHGFEAGLGLTKRVQSIEQERNAEHP